jgi:enamine deaminase RidA (YjgF/YER057c/UK114 family)
MYISGQIGMDLSGNMVSGGLEAEAEQVHIMFYLLSINLRRICNLVLGLLSDTNLLKSKVK